MADRADAYMKAGSVAVTIEVIAEAVYVLHGVYSMERKTVSETLIQFMDLVACRDRDIALLALDTYAKQNLDFVDCVLFAYHTLKGVEIATFDKKLLRLLSIKTL